MEVYAGIHRYPCSAEHSACCLPLQRRIQGYMHGILSETDYRTRMLLDTPPRAPDKAPPSPLRGAGSRPIIDLDPPRRAPSASERPAAAASSARLRQPARPAERGAVAFQRGSRSLVSALLPPMLSTDL
jgi:hypothetical protein